MKNYPEILGVSAVTVSITASLLTVSAILTSSALMCATIAPAMAQQPTSPSAAYEADTARRIRRAWFPPKGAARSSICVAFSIQPDGTMGGLRMERSSGNAMSDVAALKAIQNASPFRKTSTGGKMIVRAEMLWMPEYSGGGFNGPSPMNVRVTDLTSATGTSRATSPGKNSGKNSGKPTAKNQGKVSSNGAGKVSAKDAARIARNEARALFKKGEWSKAKNAWDDILKEDPNDPEALYKRAVCDYRLFSDEGAPKVTKRDAYVAALSDLRRAKTMYSALSDNKTSSEISKLIGELESSDVLNAAPSR